MPSRQELRQDFVRDMGVMFELKHPNVVNIMGALVDQKRDPLLGMFCAYACMYLDMYVCILVCMHVCIWICICV
jgi:hypothetical protein